MAWRTSGPCWGRLLCQWPISLAVCFFSVAASSRIVVYGLTSKAAAARFGWTFRSAARLNAYRLNRGFAKGEFFIRAVQFLPAGVMKP